MRSLYRGDWWLEWLLNTDKPWTRPTIPSTVTGCNGEFQQFIIFTLYIIIIRALFRYLKVFLISPYFLLKGRLNGSVQRCVPDFSWPAGRSQISCTSVAFIALGLTTGWESLLPRKIETSSCYPPMPSTSFALRQRCSAAALLGLVTISPGCSSSHCPFNDCGFYSHHRPPFRPPWSGSTHRPDTPRSSPPASPAGPEQSSSGWTTCSADPSIHKQSSASALSSAAGRTSEAHGRPPSGTPPPSATEVPAQTKRCPWGQRSKSWWGRRCQAAKRNSPQCCRQLSFLSVGVRFLTDL